MKFTWKNYPENPLSHTPKLQNLKKVWKIFPGYPLSHTPIFGKFFRDLPIWVKKVYGVYNFRSFWKDPGRSFAFMLKIINIEHSDLIVGKF